MIIAMYPLLSKAKLSHLPKLVNDWVNVACHYVLDVMPAFIYAVVGNAVLKEIVGADFFASVRGAYLLLSFFSRRLFLFS